MINQYPLNQYLLNQYLLNQYLLNPDMTTRLLSSKVGRRSSASASWIPMVMV